MTVKRLQNVYYTSANVGRDREFYEQVLGLKVKFADAEKWVQFDAGGQNFALSSVGEAAPGSSGAVAVFEVESIDSLVAALKARSIEVLVDRDMGSHGRTLAFRDPAGNVLQAFERKKPA
jgi:predicted enzyme related to lactoylglutathione lyase